MKSSDKKKINAHNKKVKEDKLFAEMFSAVRLLRMLVPHVLVAAICKMETTNKDFVWKRLMTRERSMRFRLNTARIRTFVGLLSQEFALAHATISKHEVEVYGTPIEIPKEEKDDMVNFLLLLVAGQQERQELIDSLESLGQFPSFLEPGRKALNLFSQPFLRFPAIR